MPLEPAFVGRNIGSQNDSDGIGRFIRHAPNFTQKSRAGPRSKPEV